jgi:hypothetical protein
MPSILLHSLLVGNSAGVAVLESVGVAFEGDDVGVVDEPVDRRGGDDLFAEDLPAIGGGRGSSTCPLRVIMVAYADV